LGRSSEERSRRVVSHRVHHWRTPFPELVGGIDRDAALRGRRCEVLVEGQACSPRSVIL
jgi:hypothetical protein